MALALCACSPAASAPTPHPTTPAVPTAVVSPPPAVSLPCAEAQANRRPPAAIRSQLPLLLVADGVATAEDLLFDDGSLVVGEYTSGRLRVFNSEAGDHDLPFRVPTAEGIVHLGDTWYVAEQSGDRVLAFDSAGNRRTFIQLRPVAGVEGLDAISADRGNNLVVPDSARGQVLLLDPGGNLVRTWTGFARPTGAWAASDGSILVADENGGAVYRLGPDGTRSTVASGLPLVDDVVESHDRRLFAISITNGALYDITDGGRTALVTGISQVQGLAPDGAGNLALTDYDRGLVFWAVRTFKAIPAGPAVTLKAHQPICVEVARAPGNTETLALSGKGWVAASLGASVTVPGQPAPPSNSGWVLPQPCGESECSISVTISGPSGQDTVWLRYRSAA